MFIRLRQHDMLTLTDMYRKLMYGSDYHELECYLTVQGLDPVKMQMT